jgi:hypothetical protein
MQKISIIFALLLLSGLLASGQQGRVTVDADPLFDTLGEHFRHLQELQMQNPDNKGIEGYRVQIFFDSGTKSGDRALEAQEAFTEEYEDVPVYITWKAPNYRVRVGDFRTRLEAEKFLQQIARDYPNAWVIKDEINYPPLKLQDAL